MIRPKIGIALGSGGARGWSHIGVLQVLEENGIEPDIVAGCSMGALIGAAYAAGELSSLAEWALSVNWAKMAALLDINVTRGGLIDGKRIMSTMNAIKEDTEIEKLEKPFNAIATDLHTGREIWLQKGSVIQAVRASIAIPGIFSPMKIDGKWLIDGGISNPVPVSACRALGAEVVIAVDPDAHLLGAVPRARSTKSRNQISKNERVSQDDILGRMYEAAPERIKGGLKVLTPDILKSRDGAPSYFDVLSASVDIATNHVKRSRLAGEPPHILLGPQVGEMGTLDFNRAEEAIAIGRKCAERALSSLNEWI